MKLGERIRRSVAGGSNFLGVSATFAIVALMLAICTDVVMRGLSGDTVPGLFEATELLLVMAIFLGLAAEQLSSGHIRVTILTEHVGPRLKTALRTIALVISAGMILWLTIETGQRALASFSTGEVRWGTVQFPVWPVRACITIGFAWYLLQVCVTIYETLVKKPETTTEVPLNSV